MSQLELQTVPMLEKEAESPSWVEFPFPKQPGFELGGRGGEEDLVCFLLLWRKKQVCRAAGCQVQGELHFLEWGALEWHCKTLSSGETGFQCCLIDPLPYWTMLADVHKSKYCFWSVLIKCICTTYRYSLSTKHRDLGAMELGYPGKWQSWYAYFGHFLGHLRPQEQNTYLYVTSNLLTLLRLFRLPLKVSEHNPKGCSSPQLYQVTKT